MPQCECIPTFKKKMCEKCQLYTGKAVILSLSLSLASVGSTEFQTMTETYLSTKHLPHFKAPTNSFVFKYCNYFLDSYKPEKIMAIFRVHFMLIINNYLNTHERTKTLSFLFLKIKFIFHCKIKCY